MPVVVRLDGRSPGVNLFESNIEVPSRHMSDPDMET